MSTYLGERLTNRPLPKDLNPRNFSLVLVTGSLPNTCGHILLYIGGGLGHYFHFTGPSLFNYPLYIPGHANYQRFLRENGKHELIRKPLTIPRSEPALARLSQLLNNKWLTLVGAHNCATFAVEVIRAGGNFYDMPDHCPALDMATDAFFESIFGPLRRKFGTEESYVAHHLR